MRRGALALAVSLTIVGPALAHSPVPGVGGFPGGLLHPVFVPAHLLALIGLGLFIGQQNARLLAVLCFAGGVAAGLGAIASAVGQTPANTVLLAAAAITGALTALAFAMPRAVGWLLAAVIGVAIGLDSPPQVISVTEATLMLIGTGIGAVVVLIVIAAAAAALRREWQRIGMRVLGSWTAASAILVLAMRFAK
jgi:urease accessory protein